MIVAIVSATKEELPILHKDRSVGEAQAIQIQKVVAQNIGKGKADMSEDISER